MKKVLFICLGNICRSPTALGLFNKIIKEQELENQFIGSSAGTSNYNEGLKADKRTRKTALSKGLNLEDHIARQITLEDFKNFDYILVADKANLKDLLAIAPKESQEKIFELISFAKTKDFDHIPDPYYGGQENFELAYNLIEESIKGLINYLKK